MAELIPFYVTLTNMVVLLGDWKQCDINWVLCVDIFLCSLPPALCMSRWPLRTHTGLIMALSCDPIRWPLGSIMCCFLVPLCVQHKPLCSPIPSAGRLILSSNSVLSSCPVAVNQYKSYSPHHLMSRPDSRNLLTHHIVCNFPISIDQDMVTLMTISLDE